jgi:hypothetical protein
MSKTAAAAKRRRVLNWFLFTVVFQVLIIFSIKKDTHPPRPHTSQLPHLSWSYTKSHQGCEEDVSF